MQRDDALQIVGEMRAVFRLAAREGVARRGRRCGGMWSTPASSVPKILRLPDDAADRDAAEADAVIAALAADQARAVPCPSRGGRRARSSARCRPLPNPNCEEDVVERRRAPCGERAASSNALGWPIWKAARSRARRLPGGLIASTIGWRPWPALQHHRPAVPSRIWRPSGVV
jgi:hypothetical protein